MIAKSERIEEAAACGRRARDGELKIPKFSRSASHRSNPFGRLLDSQPGAKDGTATWCFAASSESRQLDMKEYPEHEPITHTRKAGKCAWTISFAGMVTTYDERQDHSACSALFQRDAPSASGAPPSSIWSSLDLKSKIQISWL